MLTWQKGLAAVLARAPVGAKRRVRLHEAANRIQFPPAAGHLADGEGVVVEPLTWSE